MNDDKADAHSNLKLYSNEAAKEFLDGAIKTYFQDVPNKHQRSITEFIRIVISSAYSLKLRIRPGNSNTAEPTSIVFPEGIIRVYISNENSPCGNKQLLYWCIKMLSDKQFANLNTKNTIFELSEDGKIIPKSSPSLNKEMDRNSFAMDYAKEILHKFF